MDYNELKNYREYIAIDIETTGLKCENDVIIEIAALKYKDNCIVDEFVSLVNPNRRLPPIITDLTGITDDMLTDAPDIDDIIDDFVSFLGDLPLVAHNVNFDMGFLQKAADSSIKNPTIDTLVIARDILPRLPNHKLVTVQKHMNIRADALHRAKADAYVCGEFLKKVIAHLNTEQAAPKQAVQKSEGPQVVTVTQLNKYMKIILEKDPKLMNILVKGELSNFKRNYSSGHCYMTLKDENSAIRAVMFRGAADRLRFSPEDGMKVIVTGRVSVYERDGQYQFYIEEMQPDGIGDLYVAFEQLKEKLKAEGLFDQSRKKPIPKFPQRVGVVTSATGAAVRDIINVMTRRYPLCEIVLYPAQVQGEGGSKSVIEAIEYFNRAKNVDTLIVGRGGGSIEELWVFNEEVTARAIAASDIPIISAVGHETDTTIADFVADLRAPTPSAAAELAVPSGDELLKNTETAYNRMENTLKRIIENKRNILKRFALKSPADMVNQYAQQVDMLDKHLNDSINNAIERAGARLAVAAGRLNALSPLAVISRGYSVAQDGAGKAVRSVKQVKKGDSIITKLPDGTINSRVEDIGS